MAGGPFGGPGGTPGRSDVMVRGGLGLGADILRSYANF